jgi:hypothetical protein
VIFNFRPIPQQQLDRRNSFSNIEQNDDIMLNNRFQQQQHQQLLRYPFQNNQLIRSG